mmetsp:Transcript_53372/g.143970  ORF Transcript_53372/g.143970 Transcript_53372/m.143970 type:complete len:91 (+) Transcript_53372:45-317(+)
MASAAYPKPVLLLCIWSEVRVAILARVRPAAAANFDFADGVSILTSGMLPCCPEELAVVVLLGDRICSSRFTMLSLTLSDNSLIWAKLSS